VWAEYINGLLKERKIKRKVEFKKTMKKAIPKGSGNGVLYLSLL
jgi:hypothetical protein